VLATAAHFDFDNLESAGCCYAFRDLLDFLHVERHTVSDSQTELSLSGPKAACAGQSTGK
jgi:hypothetical protein